MNKTKNALERTVELLSKTSKIFVKEPIIEYCKDTFQLVQGNPIQRVTYPVIFRDIPCELNALNDLLASLVPNHIKYLTLSMFSPVLAENRQGRYCVIVEPGSIKIVEIVGRLNQKVHTKIYDDELVEKLNLGESRQTLPLSEKGCISREIRIFPFVNIHHYDRKKDLLRTCCISSQMNMKEWCSYGGAYMC